MLHRQKKALAGVITIHRLGQILLWVGLVVLALVLPVGWSLLPVKHWVEAITGWIDSFGAWSPVLFGLFYTVAVVLLAPAEPMSIAAGLVFGAWGFPVVLVAATIGAALAFLVSRHLFRARVKGFLRQRPKFAVVERAVSEAGWKIVILLRLSLVVPFNLQNYFFGATSIGFIPYVVATAVGIIPGSVLYVYLGALGWAVAVGEGSLIMKAGLFAVTLAATGAVAWIVTAKAKRMLQERG
jgi:uncharacterized membrane protein YdjX (TVP38/TMEM64 family)